MHQEKKFHLKKPRIKFIVDQVKIPDLLDDRSVRFRTHNNFGTWEELFKEYLKGSTTRDHNSTKRVRPWLVKKVVSIFLNLLIRDLIYNHETFVLPYKNFGKILIGINYDFKKPHYVFNIETGGLNFAPRLEFTRGGLKQVGKKYYINFVPNWEKKFQEEITNGRRYKVQKTIGYGLRQSKIHRSQRNRIPVSKDS